MVGFFNFVFMNIVQKKDLKELIYEKVNDGDLYRLYMPHEFSFNKNTINPFKTEKNPSFRIYNINGDFFHKSYNCKIKGGIWDFIKEMYGITYGEALKKVAEDLGIIGQRGNKYVAVLKNIQSLDQEPKKETLIQFTKKEFTKNHIDFLKLGNLTLEDINIFDDTKVYAVKEVWYNKSKIPILKNEVVFAYYIPSINKVKIYFPEREKGNKFLSSIPFTYIHGLENLNECENTVLSKSVKEAWLLKKLMNICVIVAQAENPSALNKESIELINSKAKNVFLSFDSDDTGVKASQLITTANGWKYINPPRKFLPLKDWWEISEKIGNDVIIEYFKKKKLI